MIATFLHGKWNFHNSTLRELREIKREEEIEIEIEKINIIQSC